MSSQTSRRLLARLSKDIEELQDSPYPGVAIFTDDADFRNLCLVLTPPSGPWKDLSLHFNVVLPNDWVIVHVIYTNCSLVSCSFCWFLKPSRLFLHEFQPV
jgi:hypothetical protein